LITWTQTTNDPLSELALKWTTDKIKWYTSFYHDLLNSRRETARKVMELGIGYPDVMWGPQIWTAWPVAPYITGASVRMWEEYFPEAQVYALDINKEILFNEGRIQSHWFDQSKAETYPLEQIGCDFDFIVDDGSHRWEDQLLALHTLAPLTSLYVIEDTGYMPHEEAEAKAKALPYKTEFVAFENKRLPGDRGSCMVVWP